MEAIIVIGFMSVVLLLALVKNRQLHRNEETLKQELEKSKKIIKFLSNVDSQTAIKPEFLVSLGIPTLQEFNYHLADLYKKKFLLELLAEAPQTVHSIGRYIELLNNLESSEEKEYLLKNFAITLYGYQSISYLIYNSLKINPEDNSDGQTVINFILTNLVSMSARSTISNIAYSLTLFVGKRRSLTTVDDAITKKLLEVAKIMENCKTKKI